MSDIEDTLERVLTCDNNDCQDAIVEGRYYHEKRWDYEHYDFDTETEKFTCRYCGSSSSEEFEVVDSDGNSTEYQNVNGFWKTIEELRAEDEHIARLDKEGL